VDRACALALINNFSKKYYRDLRVMTENGMIPFAELGIQKQPIPAFVLRYYFGGSTRHWGNVLHNGAMPTRLDLQCLRASIEIPRLEDIRIKCKMIRSMQKSSKNTEERKPLVRGAKEPITRRDGSIYNGDEWKVIDEKLNKVFGKRKYSALMP